MAKFKSTRKVHVPSNYDKKQDKKLNKLARKLKPEYKYYLRAGSGVVQDGSGTAWDIARVQVGDAADERNGMTIQPFLLKLRMDFVHGYDSATTTWDPEPNFTRLVIARDNRQSSDTNLAWTDFMNNDTIWSHPSRLTKGKATILYDTIIKTEDNANRGAYIKKDIRLAASKPVRYNGVLNTDIEANGLYLFVITNAPNGDATDSHTYRFEAQLHYTDM